MNTNQAPDMRSCSTEYKSYFQKASQDQIKSVIGKKIEAVLLTVIVSGDTSILILGVSLQSITFFNTIFIFIISVYCHCLIHFSNILLIQLNICLCVPNESHLK